MNGLSLPTLPRYAKVAVTLFLLILGLSYLVGIVNLWNRTNMTYQGVIEHLRGSEEKMIYAKELPDMLSLTHYHTGGWAMMFMFLIVFLMLSTYGKGLKGLLGVLPFCAIVLDEGAMWLTRFSSPGFAWLLIAAGGLMGTLFGLILVLDLVNIWFGKPKPAAA